MRRNMILCSVLVTVATLMAGGLSFAGQEEEHHSNGEGIKTFTVDVALDGLSTQPTTSQSKGESFVVDGTIYREGTLPSGFANNDPNAPGGIGKIRCRASLLVPFSDVTTPASSFVTELYSLPDDGQTIVVDGLGPNLFVTPETRCPGRDTFLRGGFWRGD